MPETPGNLETSGNMNANKAGIQAPRGFETEGLTRFTLPFASVTFANGGSGSFRLYLKDADGADTTLATVPYNTNGATTTTDAIAAINANRANHRVFAEANGSTADLWLDDAGLTDDSIPTLMVELTGGAAAEDLVIVDFAEAEIELTGGTAMGNAEFNVEAGGTPIAAANEAFDTDLATTAENFAASINAGGVLRARYPGSGASLFLQRVVGGPGPALEPVVEGDAEINSTDEAAWANDEPDTGTTLTQGGTVLPDTDPYLLRWVPPNYMGGAERPLFIELTLDEDWERWKTRLTAQGRPELADTLTRRLPILDNASFLARGAGAAAGTWDVDYL